MTLFVALAVPGAGELHGKVLAAEHATRRHDAVNRVLPLTLTRKRLTNTPVR